MSADLDALVASPHFLWMPGMHVIDVDGDRGVIVHVVGQRLRISYGCEGSGRRWTDLLAWQVAHECALDTDVPGSRGWLLHLVREALGGVASLETLWSGSLGRWVYHVKLADADPHHRYVASGATPDEALTAALLAAPPKTVPS